MKEKELRRTLAVFPIGSVMKLTDLTARQIRYYEDQQLITPDRTEGNRRMFSLNDMDRLLEIKDYLSEGLNIAGIKKRIAEKEAKRQAAKVVSQSIGYDTIASGDSHNDLGMIQASKAGFLFKSTDAIKSEYPEIPAYETYDELYDAIRKVIKG